MPTKRIKVTPKPADLARMQAAADAAGLPLASWALSVLVRAVRE